MKYISLKEAAARWRITERSVRRYCERGLIDGATQIDTLWIIPDDVKKPEHMEAEPPIYQGPATQVVAQRAKNNHYGIYEYLQVNLAYSSSRMASNRLTRKQVIELYRTGKISTAFEPAKVDDLVEVGNHFQACTYVIDNLNEPIHMAHLRKLHRLLFYGTAADRNGTMRTDELRNSPHKYGLPPEEISKALSALIKSYEAKKKVQLKDILAYLLAFVLLLVVEVCIALFVHDAFVRPYVGDVLVTALLCCLCRAICPRFAPALPVFLLAAAVEGLQWLGLTEILGLQGTALGIIMGSTTSSRTNASR